MLGIAGSPAPELRVRHWLANAGAGLTIAAIEEPVIYLFGFQSWCPGCHSHGFPTLRATKEALERDGLSGMVKFIAVQTVFEGHDENNTKAALNTVALHRLTDIALGHDAGNPPALMADYRTGGTPWTVIIGPRPERHVLFNAFSTSPEDMLRAIRHVLRV
jgi:thiol-disulfide isomerase/thioredoxin